MIPTYSGKKALGRGMFHYYRCNNTHKHVTEQCQLKNISGAAIEESIFNFVEKLVGGTLPLPRFPSWPSNTRSWGLIDVFFEI